MTKQQFALWFRIVSAILVLFGLIYVFFGLKILPVPPAVLLPWESALYGAIMMGWGAAACTLSPTFPAGELVFFIPWRGVAENPARRISTCSGRRGGAAAAGRTMVMSPAAPDSFSVIFWFGATMELGRSERPTMRPLWSYRPTVSAVSIGLLSNSPALTILLTHSRARGADDRGRRRRDASYGAARDSHPVSTKR